MTEAQRDDLIVELSLYPPSQIREMVEEYQQGRKPNNYNFPFYEFLKEKLEIEGYLKKVGLA
ncbi:MAG: hypothetical protein GY799_07615 [Desulfobulbaceae bacterium]|nr:hypothetical protein [Desulfobulbaceae bacterium]